MKIRNHDIGVCTWSLRAADHTDLVARVRSLELSHCQLALLPLIEMSDAARAGALATLADSGLTITATMINYPGEDYGSINHIRRTGGLVPDDQWDQRRDLTLAAAELTRKLGVGRLSTHVGFIPPPNDAGYAVIVKRITELSKPLADMGIDLLMETGQESASELLQFLNNLNCKNFGVNFDPANMVLYGSGNPIDAVHTLGRHVRHVHVKDAVGSDNPGIDWGEEVPFGDGDVPHGQFLAALAGINYTGPLVIEREAGNDRMGDVQYAIETLGAL
jgi:L-ribulose-5-phosphate 3-epimerase